MSVLYNRGYQSIWINYSSFIIETSYVWGDGMTQEDVTLIGITITFIIGIINIAIGIHNSKLHSITGNRTEWIANVRNISVLIFQYDPNLYLNEEQLRIANLELLRNADNLNMLLNIMGSFDAVVHECLLDLLANRKVSMKHDIKQEDYIKSKRKLKLAVQIYLKAEWERVKWENRYFRCATYNENKQIYKILDKFSVGETYAQEIKSKYEVYKKNSLIRNRQFIEFIELKPSPCVVSMDTKVRTEVKSKR